MNNKEINYLSRPTLSEVTKIGDNLNTDLKTSDRFSVNTWSVKIHTDWNNIATGVSLEYLANIESYSVISFKISIHSNNYKWFGRSTKSGIFEAQPIDDIHDLRQVFEYNGTPTEDLTDDLASFFLEVKRIIIGGGNA